MSTDEQDEELMKKLAEAKKEKEGAKAIEKIGKSIKPPSKNGKKQ